MKHRIAIDMNYQIVISEFSNLENPSIEDFIKLCHFFIEHDLDDIQINEMASNQLFINNLSKIIEQLFLIRTITEAGILPSSHFSKEIKNRLGRRLLPTIYENNRLEYILHELFPGKSNLKQKANESFAKFKPIISEIFKSDFSKSIKIQILATIEILSNRICNIGHEEDVSNMVDGNDHINSPFYILNDQTDLLIKSVKDNFLPITIEPVKIQIFKTLRDIEAFIIKAKRNRQTKGITLRITYQLLRLKELIIRLREVLNLLASDFEERSNHIIELGQKLIQSIGYQYSFRQLITDNLGVLAHQITEHTGKTGERYLTTSKSEYWDMFKSSAGAGFIVGLLVIFKLKIYFLNLPLFIDALLYSLNYAVGFVMIYLLNFTLATKQPAMTAAALTRSLELGKSNKDFSIFSELVAQLSRSQIIAFIGNVIVAFPVAYLVSGLMYFITGDHLMDTNKAQKMILDQNPYLSLSLFHAAIAGVYLFISGLVAGYNDNLNIYFKIPQRIKKHPFLNEILGKKRTNSISEFIKKHLGPVSGNIALGLLLGSTIVVGQIFGLPIDIRHITFAAGNFGMSIVSLDNHVFISQIVITCIGIALIGLLNFGVSFILSFMVAAKSRNISFKEYPEIFLALKTRWKKNKKSFFLP